jgi:hypothetical protein
MKTVLVSFLLIFALSIGFGQSTVPVGPNGSLPFTVATTAIDTITLNTTQVVGLLTGTPTAGATYTTPTAAALCTYFRHIVKPNQTVYSWDWYIRNTSAMANTITAAGGSGVTLRGTGTAAQNAMRHFKFSINSCISGSEAIDLISLETAVF